jgi:Protein of unknown function (DUF1761)
MTFDLAERGQLAGHRGRRRGVVDPGGDLVFTGRVGKPWLRASGVTIQEGQRPGAATYIVRLIAYFIATVAAAMLARATESTTLGEGIVLGLVLAIGIGATLYWVESTFGNRPQLAWTSREVQRAGMFP